MTDGSFFAFTSMVTEAMAGIKAKAQYDFASENLGELQFRADETLTIVDQSVGDGWWEAVNASGQKGLVPATYLEVISYPEPTIPLPPAPVVLPPGASRPPMLRSKTVSTSSAKSLTKSTNAIVGRPNSLNPSHAPQNSRPPPPYSKLQRRETCPEQDAGDFWDDDWDDDDDDDDDTSSTATTPSDNKRESDYATINEKRMSQSQKGDNRSSTYNPFNSFAHFTKIGGDAFLFGSSTLSSNSIGSNIVVIVDSAEGVMWKQPAQPFSCAVTSPKKETKYHGIKTFTTYQLIPSFSGIQVSRRYNHFSWIQHRLVEKFPTITVPPLPERQFVGRFEEAFVNTRLRYLQLWIDRMCQHPVISNSDIFQHFLTCTNQKVWSDVKKKAKKEESSGARFFLTIRSPPLDSKNAETRIDRFQRQIKVLDDNLKHLNAVGENSIKKHEGSFRKHFQKLGGSFVSLSKSFELDERSASQSLTLAISHTGKTYEEIGQLFAKQPSDDVVLLLEGIQEYRGLISCFSGAVTMHKAAAAKVGEKTGSVGDGEIQAIQERANVVSSSVLAEVQHFNRYRVGDFKRYMKTYLENQIKFYHEIAAKLEGTLKQYDKA